MNLEHVTALGISAFSSTLSVQAAPPAKASARRRLTLRSEDPTRGLLLPDSSRSAPLHRRPGAGAPTRVRLTPACGGRLAAAHVLDEQLFRTVLRRERKRAERFEQHVALMIVTMSAGGSWKAVTDSVAQVTRQTDVIGWVERQNALGVVLPECGSADAEFISRVENRVRRQLATRMDAKTLNGIAIELHVPSRREADAGAQQGHSMAAGLCGGGAAPTASDSLKRMLDIVCSLTLLTLLAPVFLAIAALVRLKSPGPVLFRQPRVGERARPFTMLKFRTMHLNVDHALHQAFVTQFIKSADQGPKDGKTLFKIADDPRVTPIGRFLRKTSLDELPQLWNVLRGDMSLVGPRPPLAYELEQYQSWHWRRVLDAKPGVTGLWQVAGRSRTTFDGMVRLDLRYVRTRSLWMDIKILLATPAAVISGRGAC